MVWSSADLNLDHALTGNLLGDVVYATLRSVMEERYKCNKFSFQKRTAVSSRTENGALRCIWKGKKLFAWEVLSVLWRAFFLSQVCIILSFQAESGGGMLRIRIRVKTGSEQVVHCLQSSLLEAVCLLLEFYNKHYTSRYRRRGYFWLCFGYTSLSPF